MSFWEFGSGLGKLYFIHFLLYETGVKGLEAS